MTSGLSLRLLLSANASHLSFITSALTHTHHPHLHLYTMVQTAESDFKVGLLLYICLFIRSDDTVKLHCPFTFYATHPSDSSLPTFSSLDRVRSRNDLRVLCQRRQECSRGCRGYQEIRHQPQGAARRC